MEVASVVDIGEHLVRRHLLTRRVQIGSFEALKFLRETLQRKSHLWSERYQPNLTLIADVRGLSRPDDNAVNSKRIVFIVERIRIYETYNILSKKKADLEAIVSENYVLFTYLDNNIFFTERLSTGIFRVSQRISSYQ